MSGKYIDIEKFYGATPFPTVRLDEVEKRNDRIDKLERAIDKVISIPWYITNNPELLQALRALCVVRGQHIPIPIRRPPPPPGRVLPESGGRTGS